ncbi:MAG: hypothetical protein Q8P18_06395 [Pseudomonadota bacterium]|nr:hypothetical protein [Pseudomonadota bacterium]
MSGIQVRVSIARRQPDFGAADDDVFGRGLVDRVIRAVGRGPLPPAVFLFRPDDVQIVYAAPLLAAARDPHRVLASLAGQPGVDAMAILGRFTQRQKGAEPRLLAGAFIEWTDGRWWASWRPVDKDGRLVPTDEDEVLRAVDGQARPGGLGGWFTRARFEGLRAELTPVRPAHVDEVVN